MASLKRLLTCALAGAFLSTLSCAGEGGTPVDPELTEQEEQVFNLLTGCSSDCISGFSQMVDGFSYVLKWLAAGTDTSDGERALNLTTGMLGFDIDMDGRSGKEIQFRGQINPFDDKCKDGMVKGDVCVVDWGMFRQPTLARVASTRERGSTTS